MKRSARFAVIVLVLGISLAPALKAQDQNQDVVQKLTKIKQQWSEAEMNKDTSFLNKLWADDCVFGTSLGTVMNKPELIALIKGTTRKVTELHSDDIHLRLYGNTAIMTDRTTMRGIYKGKPYG
ncbi:MAG: nuclear transport factor 2 family protein, partial [Terriglobia bacterium]